MIPSNAISSGGSSSGGVLPYFASPSPGGAVTRAASSSSLSSSSGFAGPKSWLPTYLKRVVYYRQMDFEYTFTQMVYLLYSPSKVYKLTAWRNQTKNQWARDDPAFTVLVCFFLGIGSVAYGISLGEGFGVGSCIRLALLNISAFWVCGLLLSTLGWYVSNTYFRIHHSHSVEQKMEWLYAFDIHANATFPMFVLLCVVQYLFLPFTLSNSFFATFCSNSLYAAGFSYYFYVSFLGYMYLPFLNKDQVTYLLYPIGVIAVTYVLFVVLRIHAGQLVLGIFFGS